MKISIIVAVAKNQVIGNNNELIWKLSADLKYFKNTTTGHHIIMGRKTYESVGKPLPNRTSVIISRNPNFVVPEGHHLVNSWEQAVQLCISKKLEKVYVIGGAEIYKIALPFADELLVTEVDAYPEGDAFFPKILTDEWTETHRESFQKDEKNEFNYAFVLYKRK
ncbi:dihydrofolate reductase [Mongoliitalea daihaiensis]|uniref:dihydrofolate reductase n=1 Tax=Mongoliitalea daihaiensis TaxID=2782006 RepID=UPI001F40CD0D|nr:dihydrofolate reductase [Mongoliitalea daihaiensis]UJP63731.1 dihydrofolate reductase [Mongoliitalea daihaiensis]